MNIHEDNQIGLTMGDRHWSERTNIDGTKYWHVEEDIGTIFGSPVNGTIEAFGRTREEAEARLKQERHNLHESLWT